MTTKEFIKRVEELGLDVEITREKLKGYTVQKYITIFNNKQEVAIVSDNKTYTLDTDWIAYRILSDKVRKDLFSILTEYVNTPLDERECSTNNIEDIEKLNEKIDRYELVIRKLNKKIDRYDQVIVISLILIIVYFLCL